MRNIPEPLRSKIIATIDENWAGLRESRMLAMKAISFAYPIIAEHFALVQHPLLEAARAGVIPDAEDYPDLTEDESFLERWERNEELDLWVHAAGTCVGAFCCIHDPSNHSLKNAPRNWRGDRNLMERICEHGVGHPDPDDLAYHRLIDGSPDADDESWARGVHGCCHERCCSSRE